MLRSVRNSFGVARYIRKAYVRPLALQRPLQTPLLCTSPYKTVRWCHDLRDASKPDEGKFAMIYTCKGKSLSLSIYIYMKNSDDLWYLYVYVSLVCNTRAVKTISKNSYNNGVVLIRCPGCQNLHLIADRLGWFEDESFDIEKFLKSKGEHVKSIHDGNTYEFTQADVIGTSLPSSTKE